GVSTIQTTLYWDLNTSCGVTILADLSVAKWEVSAGEWKDRGNGGTTGNTSNGTIVSSTVSSFANNSPITLASTTIANPLPSELILFKAELVQPDNNSCLIQWLTASEHNSSHFEVERSIDAENWQFIARSEAAGNSASNRHYQLFDLELPSAIRWYYRLKMVDMDGSYEYSRPISIQQEVSHSIGELFPVPANDYVKFQMYSNGIGQWQIKVFSADGKLVYNLMEKSIDGLNEYTINLNALLSGMYFLTITDKNGKTNFSKPFIKL
ncbi:MAG: T9SS type A sorting domain-containing protein, partial [Flavobacteriales bacterium]|nr:T9SS type A sorting domain-containing protein [Flavobacteriales bacterium]